MFSGVVAVARVERDNYQQTTGRMHNKTVAPLDSVCCPLLVTDYDVTKDYLIDAL